MKVCSKCDTANDDDAILCKGCSSSLSDVNVESYDNMVKEAELIKDKKMRQIGLIRNILVSVFACAYIIVFTTSVIKGGSLFNKFMLSVILLFISYLHFYHPEVIFMFSHLLTVYNLDDVQLSRLYILNCIIGGCIFMLTGFSFLLIDILK